MCAGGAGSVGCSRLFERLPSWLVALGLRHWRWPPLCGRSRSARASEDRAALRSWGCGWSCVPPCSEAAQCGLVRSGGALGAAGAAHGRAETEEDECLPLAAYGPRRNERPHEGPAGRMTTGGADEHRVIPSIADGSRPERRRRDLRLTYIVRATTLPRPQGEGSQRHRTAPARRTDDCYRPPSRRSSGTQA